MPLIVLKKFPSIYNLLNTFFKKSCNSVRFVKYIFCINLDHHFFLHSVKLEYYIDWFLYIKTPLCSWDNLHLVIIYNLFNMLLDQLASVLLRISASIFIGYWLIVLPTILSFVMPWHVIKCHQSIREYNVKTRR